MQQHSETDDGLGLENLLPSHLWKQILELADPVGVVNFSSVCRSSREVARAVLCGFDLGASLKPVMSQTEICKVLNLKPDVAKRLPFTVGSGRCGLYAYTTHKFKMTEAFPALLNLLGGWKGLKEHLEPRLSLDNRKKEASAKRRGQLESWLEKELSFSTIDAWEDSIKERTGNFSVWKDKILNTYLSETVTSKFSLKKAKEAAIKLEEEVQFDQKKAERHEQVNIWIREAQPFGSQIPTLKAWKAIIKKRRGDCHMCGSEATEWYDVVLNDYFAKKIESNYSLSQVKDAAIEFEKSEKADYNRRVQRIQKEKKERIETLNSALLALGLRRRSDSKLCALYERGKTQKTAEEVALIMAKMKYIHEYKKKLYDDMVEHEVIRLAGFDEMFYPGIRQDARDEVLRHRMTFPEHWPWLPKNKEKNVQRASPPLSSAIGKEEKIEEEEEEEEHKHKKRKREE